MTGSGTDTSQGPFDKLTERQKEVLMKAIQGLPSKVIARELGIEVPTVKAHLNSCFRAFGVKNRAELVYEAARLGLTHEGTPAIDLDKPYISIAKPTGLKPYYLLFLVLSLVVLFLVIDRYVLDGETPASSDLTTEELPETTPDRRSIAVLPFANRSNNEEDTFFVEGVHDDILTQIAKIGALKVISRTSVLEYRDRTRNLRDIGRELGVATILEGSVQRAGDTVRINVQLIDTETDEHLWADSYDRELTMENIFSIQSEIAESTAGALSAAILPEETARLSEVPTRNTRAYDFYLIGNNYFRLPDDRTQLPQALQMYERAVSEDSEFALAWAALSHVHSRYYWTGLDRTDTRLQLANDALQRALDLAPDSPEVHYAAGEYYYRGFRDYDRALKEYAIAARGMSGTAELAVARAEIYRRLGQWEQALAYWERASDLDPRNPLPHQQNGITMWSLREYTQAIQYADRALEIAPDSRQASRIKMEVPLTRDGDTSQLTQKSRLIWMAGIYERDYDAELEFLDQWNIEALISQNFYTPKDALYGLTYRLAGQSELAESYYQKALLMIEDALAINENDYRLYIALGEALASLGEQESAVRAARRAMALMPSSLDAFNGPKIQLEAVMRVFITAGDHDSAIEELDAYLAGPGYWSIEGLIPDPRLDPIRDDPRFQALVEKYKRQ